jgi:hypothetical protein
MIVTTRLASPWCPAPSRKEIVKVCETDGGAWQVLYISVNLRLDGSRNMHRRCNKDSNFWPTGTPGGGKSSK